MFRNRDERQPLLEGADNSSNSDNDEETSSSSEEDGNNATTQAADDTNSSVRPEKAEEGQSTYDISLPARHLYLGEMEGEGHVTVADEDTTIVLPLLCVLGRVLFPGETLPMHIYNPHIIQMLRNASAAGKPVAVLTDLREGGATLEELHRPQPRELAKVGTTADIVAFREVTESPSYYYGTCFVVKFQGRQRFRLLESIRRTNGTVEGRVEILPEEGLPPYPLELFVCPQHIYSGYMATQVMAREAEQCTPHLVKQLEKGRKRLANPRLSGSLCQVPAWVFNMYQLDYLRERLMAENQMKVFVGESASKLPSDISQLSYWLARRLPIDDKGKLELLQLNCPTVRLIKGLQILDSLKLLCCTVCGTEIAKKEHIFSMSVDGPLASYVNPAGWVHDTLTVLEASNLKRMGQPSTEHSWFPGYQWTILNCEECSDHKGWCFEATKKNLRPARFYGLTRPGLVLQS